MRGEKVEDDKQQMLFDDFIPEEHDFTFDYIVCDEAHRTTGVIINGKDESAFTKVHNNSNVAGKHRLYMTQRRVFMPITPRKGLRKIQ